MAEEAKWPFYSITFPYSHLQLPMAGPFRSLPCSLASRSAAVSLSGFPACKLIQKNWAFQLLPLNSTAFPLSWEQLPSLLSHPYPFSPGGEVSCLLLSGRMAILTLTHCPNWSPLAPNRKAFTPIS